MDSANARPYVRNARPLAPLFVALAALALTACAHGRITAISPEDSAALSGRVSGVTVTSDGVLFERRRVYDRLDADRAIEEAIVSKLVEDGHFDESGDTRVSVRITEFKLRSAGTAFWVGFMAGVDMLDGEVDIQQGEDSNKRYTFKLSSSEEWYFKYGAGARFRSLANELAEKIATLFEDSSS
jgi:hypothetical protein